MFKLSRNDCVRIRFALHSAALAMTSKPEAQEPGSRIATEIHEVNSILSRFIALIESTVEGAEFEILPQASNGTRRARPPANRLPGLGGESYAGKQGTGETGKVLPFAPGVGEKDRDEVQEPEKGE